VGKGGGQGKRSEAEAKTSKQRSQCVKIKCDEALNIALGNTVGGEDHRVMGGSRKLVVGGNRRWGVEAPEEGDGTLGKRR